MEYWDIYDKDKNKTGRRMKRNDWNMKEGDYHLTVLAAIKRSDGRFLITKRSKDKSYAAGHYEIPGGGVKEGEDSLSAVLREVYEETGLSLKKEDGELFLTYRRDNPGEGDNYFVDLYLFNYSYDDKEIRLLPGETDGFLSASVNEIESLGKEGRFLHFDSIKKVFSL